MTWLLVVAAIFWWLFVGLLYASEVRRTRKDGKLEVKFWIAGLFLGLPIILLLALLYAWLVLTGSVTRLINHRL